MFLQNEAMPPVSIQRDLPYLSADRQERLDLYLPPSRPPGTRSPGIVIIHGGGWVSGTKSAGRERNVGTTLAQAGYVCISIDYRLSGAGRYPTNIQDCKNAVRYLRKNADKYGIDKDRIGVIGGSAGGHLALMVGLTDGVKEYEPSGPYPGISSKVQAVVDMYGIADARTWHGGKDVFGDKPSPTSADFDLVSPVTHLRRGIPPILILHGDKDTTVDISQSRDLDKRLSDMKLDHQFVILPGAGHTFDLQTWNGKLLAMDLRPVVVGFFDKYLKKK